MKSRQAARLGREVSEIGFGAWAIGGSWGAVAEHDAVAALNAALDGGVTFIDTADVYGGGRSEEIIGRVLKTRGRQAAVRGDQMRPRRAEHGGELHQGEISPAGSRRV